jgi:hypothetical protein
VKTQAIRATAVQAPRRTATAKRRGATAPAIITATAERALRRAITATAEPRPKLLTVQKCEEISGESRWTWRARAYSGLVASVKMAGPKSRLLIPESEVYRLIEKGMRRASA